MTKITAGAVKIAYGVTDDQFAEEIADSLNCPLGGSVAHSQCGVCPSHHTSFKVCGCLRTPDGEVHPIGSPKGFQRVG